MAPARALAVLLAASATACRFDPSGIPGDGGNAPIDAPVIDGEPVIDAPPGTPDALVDADLPDGPPGCTWAQPPLHFDPCDATAGPGLLLVGHFTYDTDSGTLSNGAISSMPPSTLVAQQGQQARLLLVASFSLGATSSLRVTGSLPLIIASESTITIDGLLDVSSSSALGEGAGADAAACAATAATAGESAATDAADDGGSGGGGGGFQGDGGTGGDGKNTTKGDKGLKISALPGELRGGCPGMAGGDGGGSSTPGAGGSGGGAVELAARISIAIAGRINTGGQRGGRGTQGAGSGGGGGGGAGSGGMLYIDTLQLTLISGAILAANGGGGGEGGDDNEDGANNADDAQLSATAAGGGTGGADKGGNGGDGGAGGLNGGNGQNNESGGGGGGGAGFIIFRTASIDEQGGVVISPAEQTQ